MGAAEAHSFSPGPGSGGQGADLMHPLAVSAVPREYAPAGRPNCTYGAYAPGNTGGDARKTATSGCGAYAVTVRAKEKKATLAGLVVVGGLALTLFVAVVLKAQSGGTPTSTTPTRTAP